MNNEQVIVYTMNSMCISGLCYSDVCAKLGKNSMFSLHIKECMDLVACLHQMNNCLCIESYDVGWLSPFIEGN